MFLLSTVAIILAFFAGTGMLKEKPALPILGLVPYQHSSGWPKGHHVIPAIQLAVSDVNAESSGLLAHYKLTLCMKPGGCLEKTSASAAVGKALLGAQPILGIVGAPCTTSSQATSSLANHFGINQVSYGSEFADMSDTSRHPFFFRTTVSLAHAADGFSKLLDYLGRRSVVIVAQSGHWEKPARSFAIKYKIHDANNTVANLSLITESGDKKGMDQSMDYQLEGIRSFNSHIIVTFLSPHIATRLMCRAYRLGMTYPNYLWIHHLTTGEWEWWKNTEYRKDLECTSAEMQLAHNGSLIHQLQLNTTNETRYGEFIDQYKLRLEQYLSDLGVPYFPFGSNCSNTFLPCVNSAVHDQYARIAYDAVWVLATALSKADTTLKTDHGLNLSNFEQGTNTFSRAIHDSLELTSYAGLSGDIEYQSGGNHTLDKNTRAIKSGFFHINMTGVVKVAVYDATLSGRDQLQLDDKGKHLLAINETIPEDKDLPYRRLFYQEVGYGILACNAVFIVITVMLLLLNNFFYYHQPFKGSDVSLTNFQIGAVLLLTTGSTIMSVFASFDIDCAIVFGIAASTSVWMIKVGLLLFLTIAAFKSYRFYKIFVTYLSHSQSLSIRKILTLSSIVLGAIIVYESVTIAWEPLLRSAQRSSQMRMYGEQQRFYLASQVQYATVLVILATTILCVFMIFLAHSVSIRDLRFYDIHSNAMLSIGVLAYCVLLAVTTVAPLKEPLATRWPFVPGVSATLGCLLFVQVFFVWSLLWRFYVLHWSSSRTKCHCRHNK